MHPNIPKKTARGQVVLPLVFLFAWLVILEPCAGGSGVFESTGNLGSARVSHTATLLPNGKVLVAAGSADVFTTELYDPASGTWTSTGTINQGRTIFTATLLTNGKVLVVGGFGSFGGSQLASAELYDPATGTWIFTGSLATARGHHTATLLPNGKVLVSGGFSSQYLASAELYDPQSGTWTPTGSLSVPREEPTATLLPNGKVLVAGGTASGGELASAELYDPANGTWTATGSMAFARGYHKATLLPSGKVLVAAGPGLDSAELYDPATETWSVTGSLLTARWGHTMTLLPNGNVLVTGGFNGTTYDLDSAELYDPVSGTWAATGSLATARDDHTATLLPDGNVLIAAGGTHFSNIFASAELYLGPPTAPALLNTSTRLPVLTNDNVLIAGFIVTGTEMKRVLIRGIGPSLGVQAILPNPTLELHQGSVTLATNDNWKTRANGTSQQADIEATTIAPTNDFESAIIMTLSPGPYTVVLADANGQTGVGLAEIYDLGPTVNSKLANISTRGFVNTGDNAMIGGFIVGARSGSGTERVVVRALGPSVAVPGALANPTLALHDGNGALLASNDDWRTDQEAEIIATTIPPSSDVEAAIVRNLAPGNYTAIVRGVNGTTGVALVEVYALN